MAPSENLATVQRMVGGQSTKPMPGVSVGIIDFEPFRPQWLGVKAEDRLSYLGALAAIDIVAIVVLTLLRRQCPANTICRTSLIIAALNAGASLIRPTEQHSIIPSHFRGWSCY